VAVHRLRHGRVAARHPHRRTAGVAGRWFSAPDFTGPWTFATPTLPPDFAKISPEHERSRVLASVPGTVQAAEAVLLAQVPQTARVSKKAVMAPEVVFQGEPQFETIEKTTVARATNTSNDIFKVGDLYYMCFQGVWFRAMSPSGPWEVTGSIPEQIYEIPASSPSHHVTYVTVEDDDDDWVVFATAAAYTGVMVAWGCAVWGTGYYYPPYVYWDGAVPIYRPWCATYGTAAAYNPWTGCYALGAAIYGPYAAAGRADPRVQAPRSARADRSGRAEGRDLRLGRQRACAQADRTGRRADAWAHRVSDARDR